MTKTSRRTEKKKQGSSRANRKSKPEEDFECFYCGGTVKDWNWRCPHCGKLFNSGKRAIAFFVVLIVVCAIIGTYRYWYKPPRGEPWPLTISEVHPAPGNTEAWWYSQPDVRFDLEHVQETGINKKSCEKAWSISPEIKGTFSWSGWPPNLHIMIFSPLDNTKFDEDGTWKDWLKPNITYHVKITRDCKDGEGNRLDKEWDYWFTVRAIIG